MPTASEKVINRPLSGAELKEVLRKDFEKLLDGEGMLADRVAYGRCAYAIRLTLQTGNVYWPTQVTTADSSRHAPLDEGPTPEPIPMTDPPPDATFGATQLDRTIDSPNTERLRIGLPIPVDRKQPDGTKTVEFVKYPPDPNQDLGEGAVKVGDATADARHECFPHR